MTAKDPYGRDAEHPLQIPFKGWGQVARRVWTESARDNLSVIAGGGAFFALFAFLPALAALILFYAPTTKELQLGILSLVLPPQAYELVVEQSGNIADASDGALGWSLVASLGLALWSITALTQAMFSALNVAYEEPERRGLLRFYFNAFFLGVAGFLGGALILIAVVYVPIAFNKVGYTTDFERFVVLVRWPVLASIMFIWLACLYRYGPSRRAAKWRWVSVGAALATVAWLIASAGFSLYVSHFADYDKFYGSLGAVIVLLLWLYLTFYIVLLGAEINAELELQTAQDTTVGKPQPMGMRGAFVADHVAGGSQGHMRPVSLVMPNPTLAKRGHG